MQGEAAPELAEAILTGSGLTHPNIIVTHKIISRTRTVSHTAPCPHASQAPCDAITPLLPLLMLCHASQRPAQPAWLHKTGMLNSALHIQCWRGVWMQTGRSQLRRYKAKKSLVSEGEASEPSKPKSQIVEFWLVREYCDKGSLMVRSLHPHSYLPHSYVPTFMHTLSHSSMPSFNVHLFMHSVVHSCIHSVDQVVNHPCTRLFIVLLVLFSHCCTAACSGSAPLFASLIEHRQNFWGRHIRCNQLWIDLLCI